MRFEQVCDSLQRLYSDAIIAAGVNNPGQYYHQRTVIARAWQSLVEHRQGGILLADEVGLGKTFEALGVTYFYLLHKLGCSVNYHFRVLIVVPPKLLDKWNDELDHFAEQAQNLELHLVSSEEKANVHIQQALRRAQEIIFYSDKLILRPNNKLLHNDDDGFFFVRESTLTKLVCERGDAGFSVASRFTRMPWDVLIFDEAHGYAKGENGQGNKRSRAARSLCEVQQEAGAKILLCTATPFQLDTSELVALLGLIESNVNVLDKVRQAIDEYNRSIVALRCAIENGMKDEEADGQLALLRQNAERSRWQVETRLRPYILRSRRPEKEGRETRQYVTNPVLPGERFPWIYWQVKDWARALAQDPNTHVRTFLPTTLHMTLSSPAALTQHLRNNQGGSKTGQVAEIRRNILQALEGDHPKLDTLREFIQERIERAAKEFSGEARELANHKCVIFVSHPATIQTLIGKSDSATELAKRLNTVIQARTDQLMNSVNPALTRKELHKVIRQAIRHLLSQIDFTEADKPNIWETPYEDQTENEYWHLQKVGWGAQEDLSLRLAKEMTPRRRSIGETLAANLFRKLTEPLNEFDLVHQVVSKANTVWEQALMAVVQQVIQDRTSKAIKSIREQYESGSQSREWLRLRLSRLAYAFNPRQVIEDISGRVDFSTRQQIINAFNNDLYPLILLCSAVAEEGIDLQKRCNTVIHYDLEWNPAKVEQREGRVDRLGRESDDQVRIITFKLTDMYDERILTRCQNRRIWMELYLCKQWKEEDKIAEEESIAHPAKSTVLPNWLAEYRLDLRPRPV